MPCPASCTVSIPIDIKPRKFDEYYDIARDDEKAASITTRFSYRASPERRGTSSSIRPARLSPMKHKSAPREFRII